MQKVNINQSTWMEELYDNLLEYFRLSDDKCLHIIGEMLKFLVGVPSKWYIETFEPKEGLEINLLRMDISNGRSVGNYLVE